MPEIEPPGRSTMMAVPFTGKDTVDEVVACTAFVRTVPWPMMLWWSFAYNFVALPLAITGHVTPWLAGIGMSASSLLVVLNSLRIQRLETD